MAVAGERSDDFLELRDEIRARPGEATQVTIERDGQEQTLTITPTPTPDEETGETIGLLGFVPQPETERLSTERRAVRDLRGPVSVPAMMGRSLKAIGSVFGPEGLGRLFQQVTGQAERGAEGGMSIVGAGAVAGQGVAAFGVMFLLLLIASVNVFIGVFNLLPLPPLDGGHLAVLGVERGVNACAACAGGRPTSPSTRAGRRGRPAGDRAVRGRVGGADLAGHHQPHPAAVTRAAAPVRRPVGGGSHTDTLRSRTPV